ncbi:MAG TPA: hypothetical protein VEU55_08150 [Gemmatimonadales bacterium]|nr:hypothetical protein [Gemmatimonadales bacterium]
MAEELRWGRVKAETDYPVRRGAWYRVSSLPPGEVVLDVNRKPLALPRSFIELVATPPRRWTVVPRPAKAPRLPEGWGDQYVVCPSCRHRSPVHGAPQTMRCPRCYGLFLVAWDEHYLGRE